MSGRAVAEVLLSDVRLSAERFLDLERFACWLFHLSNTHGEGSAEGGRQRVRGLGLAVKSPTLRFCDANCTRPALRGRRGQTASKAEPLGP